MVATDHLAVPLREDVEAVRRNASIT